MQCIFCTMTHTAYRTIRLRLKLTQAALADALEISLRTVKGRESGEMKISREAQFAILHLKKNSVKSR